MDLEYRVGQEPQQPERWYHRLYQRLGKVGTAAFVLCGAAIVGDVAIGEWNADLAQTADGLNPGPEKTAYLNQMHTLMAVDKISTIIAIGSGIVAAACYLRIARRDRNAIQESSDH
ncbi:MAG TPA: hypothetical protein VGS28_00600 [Candidatus Saccharimonadales bacterium]|nr:hypothetical protein [Candidatus Saccharimonadales bacterium]